MILFERPQHIQKEKKKAQEMRQSRQWHEALQTGMCYHCRQKFKAQDLTMDHLIPISLGGHSRWDNVVVCCKSCNNLKKNMTPVEWVLFKKKNFPPTEDKN